MEDVEKLMKNTVDELDRLLNARNVLGDPIDRDGATIIPIVSFGFGFGAVGVSNPKSGDKGGSGGGGGIKPLGAIIIDDNGARVEGIKGTVSDVAGLVTDTVSKAIARRTSKDSSSEA